MLDTLLLRTSLHYTQLDLTSLHYTCRHFTSSYLNFTQLHFSALSFDILAHLTRFVFLYQKRRPENGLITGLKLLVKKCNEIHHKIKEHLLVVKTFYIPEIYGPNMEKVTREMSPYGLLCCK